MTETFTRYHQSALGRLERLGWLLDRLERVDGRRDAPGETITLAAVSCDRLRQLNQLLENSLPALELQVGIVVRDGTREEERQRRARELAQRPNHQGAFDATYQSVRNEDRDLDGGRS